MVRHMNEESREVFRGSHLAESMRHSGYRNTALALAEIIDNSVEANANHIELLCAEKHNYVEERSSKQLEAIAIFDDGDGMNTEELWNSLLMGEGTRHQARGIGKFGMGLPNSSISQCKNVTVYSWKSPDKIMEACLDLDRDLSVKKPKESDIPDVWKSKSAYIKNAKSGTLVIWSKLDRFQWRRTSTLQRNTERIVGRTYRKFLHDNKLEIKFITFDLETNQVSESSSILPNDPLYQMVPSSTPEPWNRQPMFKIDGDSLEETFKVKNQDVIIRCTLTKKEAREPQGGRQAGSLPHGKHANSNLGISVIRANRELYIDTNLCQTYDPLERWWGVEVEFPNELDDVFGVSNTKQDAAYFSAMTHEVGAITRNEEGENYRDVDEDEAISDLRKLVEHIDARIKSMRRTIKSERPRDTQPSTSDPEPWTDPDTGPTVTDEQDKTMSDQEKEKSIADALSRIHDPETASSEARYILDNKIKTRFEKAALGNPYFFDVTLKGGVAIITLNTDHPAYKYIIRMAEDIPEGSDKQTNENIRKLRGAINLIFVSWAYYENHTLKDEDRERLWEVRYDWSKRLKDLMKTLQD